MNLRLSCSLLAVSAALSVPASAQYLNSGPSSSGSASYAAQGEFNERPLSTNAQDFSVFVGPLANPKFGTNEEAGVHAIRLPFGAFESDGTSEVSWFFQAGAAYGIVRGLEAGFFIPPLLLAPQTGSGDLPLFVTWASSVDDVDIGIRNTLTVPVRSDSFWRWNPGLHMLMRFARGRLDLGAFFPMIFVNETVVASLEVPLRMSFGVGPQIFLGLETGLRKLDLAKGENDLFVPLGASVLYSLEAGEHSFDFAARFYWQSFAWVNAAEGFDDRVLQDTFTISFGANMHFDVGGNLKKKKKKSSPSPAEPAAPQIEGRPKPGSTP